MRTQTTRRIILLIALSLMFLVAACTKEQKRAVEPIPSYLKMVYPVPGTTIDLQEYSRSSYDDRHYFPDGSRICVGLYGHRIAEPGDTLDSFYDNLAERAYFEIDGRFLKTLEVARLDALTDPDSGKVNWWYGTICSPADLDPGVHHVLLTIRRSSGLELSVNWWFELVEQN